ncbi:hypothetical protein [Robertkochia aurantiaca]|uniref:hypothetical protein n=1 Tax=Robertkochia aurantiaca TaxID=2873700 RepID=UPI001CCF3772|nr:hypothetical protein [Robertkochia sp. 3YJGBD-33]
MRDKPVLYAYLIASAIFLAGVISGMPWVEHTGRLLLVPIAYLYYSRAVIKRHYLPLVIMVLCWLGLFFGYVLSQKWQVVSFISYSLAYIILTVICFKSIRLLRVKRLLYSALPVIILWFVYFIYSIKDIFGNQMGKLYPYVMGYSIILSLFMIVTLVSFFNKETKIKLFAVIIALSFVVGDIMIGFYNYLEADFLFKFVNAVATVAAYFFLARFITAFNFRRLEIA